jgi:integrase
MENYPLPFVNGTAALAPVSQLEAEFAKDRWDARNIPGLKYAPHRSSYNIIFEDIPFTFRPLAKEFAKFRIASGRSAKTLADGTYYLKNFFIFYCQRYPDATTLESLSEQDIDDFILQIKARVNARGRKSSYWQHWLHVHYLETFLCYLERIQSPMRPHEPTTRLIWSHHYPPIERPAPDQTKYIQQSVLTQLDSSLQHLRPVTYIPVVILLRASGWRISDVLYLKWDTCPEQESGKYWLVGDIQKTRVLGHKIPITEEVAVVVRTQIAWVKQHYTSEENPHRWLFPASKKNQHCRRRRFLHGDPLESCAIRRQLNELAIKSQIRDEQGNIFHFRLHAFSHTKAVEIINNGMSLVMVQQWMAHASPEMTLIYAKILDETMRTQWEKTVAQGIVQFNDGKPEYVPGKKLLPMAGENAFDPERVREHWHNVKMALGSCLKTAKIVCKFVELPCFHCPAYVLTPEDLPALEAYEQQILERVEIGKQAGNAHWIEVNQKNLDERVRPAIALLRQGHIVAKTERQEREYTDEEWEQRQQNQQ